MEPVRLCRSDESLPSRTSEPAAAAERLAASPAQAMSASELMYFFGAPLAHIVEYQDRLRTTRCEKSLRLVARSRRACGFAAQLAMAASTLAIPRPGGADDA